MLIPSCLYITMDDLGWFCGTDDRPAGGSSRSGMPRRHCAEDYAAVNELGRRLNMKINCAFVLGEWDPDNRLKRIPYLSYLRDHPVPGYDLLRDTIPLQTLCRRPGKNGVWTVDIRKVPKPEGLGKHFYISSETEFKGWTGCNVTLFEVRNGFMNYEVTPCAQVMTFF